MIDDPSRLDPRPPEERIRRPIESDDDLEAKLSLWTVATGILCAWIVWAFLIPLWRAW